MLIYELVYTDGGVVDHDVVTADSESEAEAQWNEYREGHEELLGIEEHGSFTNSDIFEEIRKDIAERGVPEKYQN